MPAPIFETLRFYNGDSVPQNSLSDKQPNTLNSGPQNNMCTGTVSHVLIIRIAIFTILLIALDNIDLTSFKS